MIRLRLYIAIAVVIAVPAAVAGAATTVRAPKAGQFAGPLPHNVLIQVAGRSVELAAFSFPCDDKAWGRTSLNGYRLKRTDRGYRFNADANGIVSYSDGGPDQNGAIHMSGRFSLDAKTVRGHMRVKTKRCGETDDIKWRAER